MVACVSINKEDTMNAPNKNIDIKKNAGADLYYRIEEKSANRTYDSTIFTSKLICLYRN